MSDDQIDDENDEQLEQENTPEPSLRDSIVKVRDEIAARETPDPQTQEGQPDPNAQPKPSADGRDEKGRFAKKAPAAPDPAAVGVKPGQVQNGQGQPQPQPQAGKPGAPEAPKMWSAERKAKFQTFPPEAQALIMEREREIEEVLGKQDADRTFGKTIRGIVTPYEGIIRGEGGTPEKAVDELLKMAYWVRRGDPEQKASIIVETIKRFGIDMGIVQRALGAPGATAAQPGNNAQPQNQPGAQGNQGGQPYAPSVDPNKIKSEIIDELTMRDLNDKIGKEIQAFASDPANTHFLKVNQQMAVLMGNGQAATLKDAYEMACWMHPEVRSILLEAQRTAQPQPGGNQGPDLDRKRKAASSLSGSPGNASEATSSRQSSKPNASLRDTIVDAVRQHEGRG